MNPTRTAVMLLSLIVLFDRPAFAQPPTFSRIDTASTLSLSGGVTVGDFNVDGCDLKRSSAPASPRAPLVRDFNGDGKLDLALADQGGGVSILLGKGDGTFATATNFRISGGAEANAIVAGDFNGDGVLDIAASNPGPPNFTGTTVSVLLGNGDGTFGPPTDFIVGTDPFVIGTADFDRNSELDLAVVNYMSASVSVLLGKGDGTFAPKLDALDGPFPVGIGAADFNGDGRADIAIGSGAPSLAVLLGNGDGTMGPVNSFAAVTSAQNLAVADFNLDGKADVVIVYLPPTNAFSVFLNTTMPDTTPSVGSYRVQVSLTASREGSDRDGRTYSITVSAKDKAGNLGSGKTDVHVPHDRGHSVEHR